MTDPTGIGDIIKALKQESPLGKQLEQARIWEEWPRLAGEELWMHGRPKGIREKTLTIEVENPVWMHRYAYAKRGIIRRINRMVRQSLVDDIFVALLEDGEEIAKP